jgi:probable rRNA maturation factor
MRSVVQAQARLPRAKATATRLARLCRRYLTLLGLNGVEVSISVVDDEEIRVINRTWRAKDQPTDVLSFPAGAAPLPPDHPRPLGDVIISLETARTRSFEEGRSLEAELARYLAHGLLHLLGHDHHKAEEARRMARAERKLLGGVGMVGSAWRLGLDSHRSPRPGSRRRQGGRRARSQDRSGR